MGQGESSQKRDNAPCIRAVTPDPKKSPFLFCVPSLVYQPDSLGASAAHSVVAAAAPVSQVTGAASLHSVAAAAGKPAPGAASQSPAPAVGKPDSMATGPTSSTSGSFSSSTFSSASASGSRSAQMC
jgi:hypothetical protein